MRLAGFGQGLERDINITLEFVSSQMNFDTEGISDCLQCYHSNVSNLAGLFQG